LSLRITRLFASLIDTLLSGSIVIGISSYFAGSFATMVAWQKTLSPLQSFEESVGDFALFLILHGYLLARNGQTIGKWVCGIRIVRADRSKASLWRILVLREMPFVLLAAIPVPYMFSVLAVVDALLIFRKSRQCLHDQIADTVVVYV
jgi:uncharacterized RDD family membrane protein YckC